MIDKKGWYEWLNRGQNCTTTQLMTSRIPNQQVNQGKKIIGIFQGIYSALQIRWQAVEVCRDTHGVVKKAFQKVIIKIGSLSLVMVVGKPCNLKILSKKRVTRDLAVARFSESRNYYLNNYFTFIFWQPFNKILTNISPRRVGMDKG